MKNPVMNAAMNYGGMLGVALIIVSLLVYLMGMQADDTVSQVLTWIVMIGGLFFFMKRYRDNDMGGFATYGQAFLAGFLIMVFAGIISGFYSYIFMSFIDPEMIDMMKEKMYEQSISSGQSEEQAIQAIEMVSPYLTPGMISISSVFSTALIGAIISAVMSAFIKRDNPNPFADAE